MLEINGKNRRRAGHAAAPAVSPGWPPPAQRGLSGCQPLQRPPTRVLGGRKEHLPLADPVPAAGLPRPGGAQGSEQKSPGGIKWLVE